MISAIPTTVTLIAKAPPITFLYLPPELRAEIYVHALVTKDSINLHRRKGRIMGKLSRYNSTLKHDLPCKHFAFGLLRASKQMHAETAPLLYGNNVFLIASSDHFAEWIETIGKNAEAVRLIKLLYASTCHRFFFDILLSSVPSLTKLEIPFGRLSRVDDTISHLKSFVVGKVEKAQGSNAGSDALRILAFYDDRDSGCTTSESGNHCPSWPETWCMFYGGEVCFIEYDLSSPEIEGREKTLAGPKVDWMRRDLSEKMYERFTYGTTFVKRHESNMHFL